MNNETMPAPATLDLVPRLRFPEFRDGWIFVFSEKIFEQISNKNHNSNLSVLAITQDHGAIPRERIDYHVSVTGKSIEGYKVVEIGDFIISLRSFQGGIEYSQYQGICSPAYVILRLKLGYSGDYFRHFLKTPRFIGQMTKNIEGLRDGKMVSYKQFSQLKLPVPALPEQKRIADCLSSLDEVIEAHSQKLELLKQHKKALMSRLFPVANAGGEGVIPRLRFPEFKDAGEWRISKLAEICDVLQGYGFPEAMQGRKIGKYPFHKVSDISRAVIKNGGSLFEATNYVDESDLIKLRAKKIPVGATVFAKIGEALRLNRRGFIQKECAIDNNITGLKAYQAAADDYFIYLSSQLIDMNEYCGGAVPSVNKSSLEKIEVVIPSLAEQRKIADCLSSLDEVIEARGKKITALKNHKKSLLQCLFLKM